MDPTILVIGATGNTGKNVLRTLPGLLATAGLKYRILGLTRSTSHPVSQELAQLPGVEMIEKDWTRIDSAWLKDQNVLRAFVAPHNLAHQFYDESTLLVAMLNAGVKYVVKVSTMLEFLGPANPVFYGRTHWAIEEMLSQPEFDGMQWTSLRPNVFTSAFLYPAAHWVKNYRATGERGPLQLMVAADAPVSLIDPDDVGRAGAALLALEDVSQHHKGRYVLRGADDITGKEIVKWVEEHSGTQVPHTEFKATGMLDAMLGDYPESAPASIAAGCEFVWDGKCTTTGVSTAPEIARLAPPQMTAKEAFEALLK